MEAGELSDDWKLMGYSGASDFNRSVTFPLPTMLTFFPLHTNESAENANLHVELICLRVDEIKEGVLVPSAEELLDAPGYSW